MNEVLKHNKKFHKLKKRSKSVFYRDKDINEKKEKWSNKIKDPDHEQHKLNMERKSGLLN